MHLMILQSRGFKQCPSADMCDFTSAEGNRSQKSVFGYYLGAAHSQPFDNCDTFNVKVLTYITWSP